MAMAKRPESKGPVYLLLDTSSILLARAELKGPPDDRNMQFQITSGKADDVVAAGVVQAIAPDKDLPLQLGRVILRRGNLVVLEPLRKLGAEVRQNLRMPVDFDTFVFPREGGRIPVRANDLSCGGISFFTRAGFQPEELFHVVIPITDGGPLIVQAGILREASGGGDERLYAAKFVDLIHDEEVLIREAVFSVQIQRKDSNVRK